MLSIDDVCCSLCGVRDRFGVWKIDFREIWNSVTCPERPATVLVRGWAASPSGARVGRFLPNCPAAPSRRAFFCDHLPWPTLEAQPAALREQFSRARDRRASHPGPMAMGPNTIEANCRSDKAGAGGAVDVGASTREQPAVAYCTVRAPRALALKSS